MRKVISMILAVLVFVLCLCGCQKPDWQNDDEMAFSAESTVGENDDKTLAEKLILEIDGAYIEDSKLPEYNTTVGMVDLAEKYTEKWEQVADDYYNKIMEHDGIVQPSDNYYSSDDLHTFVSNMKANWEQYNQTQCDNYMKVLQTVYAGGTIVGPIFADYQYEMQKNGHYNSWESASS